MMRWFAAVLAFTFPGLTQQANCTESDFRKTYPCGNGTRYTYFGSGICFGWSEDNDTKTWEHAREICMSHGGDLAIFPHGGYWFHVKASSRHSPNEHYWIGARRWGTDGPLYWLDKSRGEQVNMTAYSWRNERNDSKYSGNGTCVEAHGGYFNEAPCDKLNPFMCRLASDGYSKTTLQMTPVLKRRSGYNLGETIGITCRTFASEGVALRLKTEAGDIENVDFDTDPQFYNNIGYKVISITPRSTQYLMVGIRCLVRLEIKMIMVGSTKLGDTSIHCCNLKPRSECDIFKVTVIDPPDTPEVKLVNQLGSETIGLENNIEYYCVSKFEDGDRVTFVLVQGGSYWGRSFSINGSSVDSGTMPDWFNEVEIEHVSGRDNAHGGSFINVSLTFKFVYTMIDTQVGCYSVNVLDDVRAKAVKPGDIGSNWCDLSPTSALFSATLTIYVKETHEADECSATQINCLITRTGNGSLVFQTSDLDGQGTVTFNAQNSEMTSLAGWLNIRDYKKFVHPIYGPFTNLLLEETGVEKVKDQDIKCKVYNGTEFIQDTDQLISKKESQPSQVTQQFYDSENKYFMRFKCLSHLGEGETQTWKLSDDTDTSHIWFVTKDGNVSGHAPLPWLEIQFMSSTWYFDCGYSVTSIIKIRRQGPTNAHTIACYSYNISEVSNSSYTDEMTANFTIPDIQADTIKSDSTKSYLIFVPLTVLLFLVLLIFAPKCFIKDNPGVNSGVEEEQMHVRAQLASHMTKLEDIGTEKVSPKDENVDVSCISEDSIIRSSRKVSTIPASHTDEEL